MVLPPRQPAGGSARTIESTAHQVRRLKTNSLGNWASEYASLDYGWPYTPTTLPFAQESERSTVSSVSSTAAAATATVGSSTSTHPLASVNASPAPLPYPFILCLCRDVTTRRERERRTALLEAAQLQSRTRQAMGAWCFHELRVPASTRE
jgi:hypothetical protein